jgi:LPXTG-motif cell wall-anchored protein
MNFTKVSKVVGAGVIAASLALVPLTLPAHAQNNTTDNTSNTSTQSDTSTQRTGAVQDRGPIRQNTNGDNNDLGWFGLLGLIGLAGLAGKKRKETVHHVSSEPNVGVRTGSDYR